jgi:hypothetical protein
MNPFGMSALLVIAFGTGQMQANDSMDLRHVRVPDDQVAAADTLCDWLCARGYDCQRNKNTLFFRRGLVINVLPLVYKGELDRLRVTALYVPKDEFKGSAELAHIVEKSQPGAEFPAGNSLGRWSADVWKQPDLLRRADSAGIRRVHGLVREHRQPLCAHGGTAENFEMSPGRLDEGIYSGRKSPASVNALAGDFSLLVG